MKKIILLLLCGGVILGLIGCGSNAAPTITESTPITLIEKVTTEISEDTSSLPATTETINETVSVESCIVESKPESSQTKSQESEVDESIITSVTESTIIEKTHTEEIVEQEIADSTEIERLVVQYINEYRAAQGDTTATVLPGLTNVARYRAIQLIDNFDHIDIREVCEELKYGRYFDMTEYGMNASYNYYEGYDREAICKGEWFGTADMIAKNIATGFKNSTKHWEYVGDTKYGYIAVGITYNEIDKYWYGCVCMSSENYGG